jgi:hypothetical protein
MLRGVSDVVIEVMLRTTMRPDRQLKRWAAGTAAGGSRGYRDSGRGSDGEETAGGGKAVARLCVPNAECLLRQVL